MRINLIQFYDHKDQTCMMNASSLPETSSDYADKRTSNFFDEMVQLRLLDAVRERIGSGYEFTNVYYVKDVAEVTKEAKSRGIGVAFDEDDMKRRNSTCSTE